MDFNGKYMILMNTADRSISDKELRKEKEKIVDLTLISMNYNIFKGLLTTCA